MDNRLFCDCCGEIGKVVLDEKGVSVVCVRDGSVCCATSRQPTEEAAIARWQKMHEEQ